jgi:tetratricopeptide (TPR) repeat protein
MINLNPPTSFPFPEPPLPSEVHLRVARFLNLSGSYLEAYHAAMTGLSCEVSSGELRAELHLNAAIALLHLGRAHDAYICIEAGLQSAPHDNRDLRAALYVKAGESLLHLMDFRAAARAAHAAAEEASTEESVVFSLADLIQRLREVWRPNETETGRMNDR